MNWPIFFFFFFFFFFKKVKSNETLWSPLAKLRGNFKKKKKKTNARWQSFSSTEVVAVVMRVGAIEAAAQLHRHVVVGIGKPLDAQQRRAAGQGEQAACGASERRRGSFLRRAPCARRTPVSNSAYVGPLVAPSCSAVSPLKCSRAATCPRGWWARRRRTARAASAPPASPVRSASARATSAVARYAAAVEDAALRTGPAASSSPLSGTSRRKR